jgi:hypothetical protein
MSYIAPRRHKPRAAANTGSTSLLPNSNCCIGPFPDGQEAVFKKIMTPWCRRRLVHSPGLGFLPASDGRGVTVKAMKTPCRRAQLWPPPRRAFTQPTHRDHEPAEAGLKMEGADKSCWLEPPPPRGEEHRRRRRAPPTTTGTTDTDV